MFRYIYHIHMDINVYKLIYKAINDSNNAQYESEELGWFYYYNLNYMKWYTLFEWALRLYMANSSVTTTKSKKKNG